MFMSTRAEVQSARIFKFPPTKDFMQTQKNTSNTINGKKVRDAVFDSYVNTPIAEIMIAYQIRRT